jgi:hypothetical protein
MKPEQKQFFILITIVLAAGILLSPATVMADPSKGNNGQCKKLQKTLPPEIQDFQGCHDTFTGKGHNEPPPLP